MEHSNFQQHATPETVRIMAFRSKDGLLRRSPRLLLALGLGALPAVFPAPVHFRPKSFQPDFTQF